MHKNQRGGEYPMAAHFCLVCQDRIEFSYTEKRFFIPATNTYEHPPTQYAYKPRNTWLVRYFQFVFLFYSVCHNVPFLQLSCMQSISISFFNQAFFMEAFFSGLMYIN